VDFVTVAVKCPEELIDVLIAELFEIGFDSFQEFDDGFEGSCNKDVFSESLVAKLIEAHPSATFSIKEQEKINWNEEWEKNYDSIVVKDKCLVRATFHQPDKKYPYEIIIHPKMSFGTGHHATTYQMLAYQMSLDHKGKKVLDVGCGTGVLSIMAHKRGASGIMATDIDDWCIENSYENFSLNDVEGKLIKGQIDLVEEYDFDIIIANINKNVLIEQMGDYAARLKADGQLLLSGFYQEDVNELVRKAKNEGLNFIKETEKDNWSMLVFENNSSKQTSDH
jgi:ribosomal protein L11 methyltransferase